jgi:hypothetical protein
MVRRRLKLPYRPQGPIPSIYPSGDFDGSPQGRSLRESLQKATSGAVEIAEELRDIKGMSGLRYRALVNHLVHRLVDVRYLEIGSWAGSTLAAAMFGNQAGALCIDDWSEFGGPRNEFLETVAALRGADTKIDLIEQDFRKVDYRQIGIFDVYLFDGPHGQADHYDSISLVMPALDERFVLVVDDWNWRRVRVGTLDALTDLSCTIECAVEIRTSHDDRHSRNESAARDWHNGYFIAVVLKSGQGSLAARTTRRVRDHLGRLRDGREIKSWISRFGPAPRQVKLAREPMPEAHNSVTRIERRAGSLHITSAAGCQHEVLRCAAMAIIVWRCAPDLGPVSVDLSDGDAPVTGCIAFCCNLPSTILVPDQGFVSSGGYAEMKKFAAAQDQAWSARTSQILWRGSTTGSGSVAAKDMSPDNGALTQRTRMCLMLRSVDGVDARFSGLTQVLEGDDAYGRLSAAGIMGDVISQVTWFGLKFAIDIDGNTNSWSGLYLKLLMGCCVIKVASPGNYRQWYYDDLKPWVHFVPVRDDLSDLHQKIEWCRANQKSCEEIASTGRHLAMSMTFEREIARAVKNIEDASQRGPLDRIVPRDDLDAVRDPPIGNDGDEDDEPEVTI